MLDREAGLVTLVEQCRPAPQLLLVERVCDLIGFQLGARDLIRLYSLR